jgi:uncharacterized protein YkwD
MYLKYFAKCSLRLLLSLGFFFWLTQPPARSIEVKNNKQLDCDRQEILTESACPGDGLGQEEMKLYNSLMAYRRENGLPSIPLSPSLNLVANRHVLDLEINIGNLTHGWSNCPYSASNRSTYSCMWDAPQRLGTTYSGYGYENAFSSSGEATAGSALPSWQGSPAHNAVILNQGMWQDNDWKAIGIGIHRGYAVLWFGEETDPATLP